MPIPLDCLTNATSAPSAVNHARNGAMVIDRIGAGRRMPATAFNYQPLIINQFPLSSMPSVWPLAIVPFFALETDSFSSDRHYGRSLHARSSTTARAHFHPTFSSARSISTKAKESTFLKTFEEVMEDVKDLKVVLKIRESGRKEGRKRRDVEGQCYWQVAPRRPAADARTTSNRSTDISLFSSRILRLLAILVKILPKYSTFRDNFITNGGGNYLTNLTNDLRKTFVRDNLIWSERVYDK